jgi:hypothetical protein
METENRDAKGRFTDGNPGGPGRPRFSIVAIMREKLQEVPDGEKRTRAERMIDEYLADAESSKDGVAIRDIINRFDGMPKQSVDVHDDRDVAWHGLLRDVFFGTESETTGDSGALQEGTPEDTDT